MPSRALRSLRNSSKSARLGTAVRQYTPQSELGQLNAPKGLLFAFGLALVVFLNRYFADASLWARALLDYGDGGHGRGGESYHWWLWIKCRRQNN